VSVEALRALERAHAWTAWAATAALIAAAWIFATSAPPRRPRGVGALAMALVVATAALGFALHDPYRSRLRQKLFLTMPSFGWLFERKLHAAFAAVLLALGALAIQRLLEHRSDDGAMSRDLTRSAVLAWTASAALALAASVASAIVARAAHF
jgi:hypothetical protein